MSAAEIFDVGSDGFQSRVIEASRAKPVLVDFWASWCGPCRMLGPILETVVTRHAGAVALAKVDADREQALTARYGVRGLPTVKLFRDGDVVGEFVGARPEQAVEEFLRPHLRDPQVGVLEDVRALEDAGRRDEALQRLEAALAQTPASASLTAALGERYLHHGHADKARSLYEALPASTREEPPVRGLAARLRFADVLAHALPPGELAAKADAGDVAALYELAAYDVMADHLDDAAGRVLRAFEIERGWRGGLLRRAMLDLMEIAGPDDPRVAAWRKRLAQLLY